MKTAKELMKEHQAKDDWKSLKLWSWANEYEKKATEWNNIFPPVADDRRLFINTYNQVYEAVESLPDNPPAWVCCAITHEMYNEMGIMNNILSRFA